MFIFLAQVFAAIVLTILPGAWIIYGLRPIGLPALSRLAMAIALSPAVVGSQLVILESAGVPFAIAAKALVFVNLPCIVLIVRRVSTRPMRVGGNLESWLPSILILGMIISVPILVWSFIPNMRTYQWETMLQTDVVYTVARDGMSVEEASLAGLNLAYGWIGHSYWSIIGWIGDWSPTTVYPFTNILWVIVTFILSYQLGVSGLGLHRSTALLGVTFMFLATNVVGMILLISTGASHWWERYFGDIRYSPLLSKFYAFDTMLWGMALLITMTLVYTNAIRRKVAPLEGLTLALLISLGLVYPVLFPAGLVVAGGFLFLVIARLPDDLPVYTRREMARLGFVIVFSIIVVSIYLVLTIADRDVAIFALSGRAEIRFKAIRFLGAMGPFLIMAALPSLRMFRRRHGPALLMILSAMVLSAVYVGIDLTHLEYKYVLSATIFLAFLAAAAVDSAFRRHAILGSIGGTLVTGSLIVINLLLVFRAGGHIPGNLHRGLPLDESSFWITLSPSDPDAAWTTAIREHTSENTVVIARKPGVHLSALVARSMYIPSDTEGGSVPGYNLDQRFYLLQQRGYPADVYNHRLGVVETLYAAKDEPEIIEALHSLKELNRPVAIYFPSRDTDSLHWLEERALGRDLVHEVENIVWFVEDSGKLP